MVAANRELIHRMEAKVKATIDRVWGKSVENDGWTYRVNPTVASKITIMVTFTIVSEYSLTSPTRKGGEKIASGPLYDLERVKGIVKNGTGLQLWTRDCVRDVAELGWDHGDVINLILRLRTADYIDSEWWCENGRGAFAACDAYSVGILERIETANKNMRIEYFVKFAINKLGTMVLTVSCHT